MSAGSQNKIDGKELEKILDLSAKPTSSKLEKICGLLFWVLIVGQIGIAFAFLGSVNTKVLDVEDCGDGWNSIQLLELGDDKWSNTCVTDALHEEWSDCLAGDGARRLASTTGENETFWEFFARIGGSFVGIFFGMVFVAVVWLLSLRRCAKQIIWGAIGLDFAALIALGIIVMQLGGDGLPFFIMAGAFAALVAVCRKKINIGGQLMQEGTNALVKNPFLFVACGLILAIYIGYCALWCAAMAAQGEIRQVTCTEAGASLEIASWLGDLSTIMLVGFFFTTNFVQNAKLMMCTVVIGSWFFDGNKSPQGQAMIHFAGDKKKPSAYKTATRWICWDLSGANGFAAFIVTLADMLESQANQKICCCPLFLLNPFVCMLKIIWMCVKGCVEMYSRFGLMAACFTGKGFVNSSRWAWGVLKDQLGQMVVTGCISHRVTSWGVMLFSICFMFLGWAVADLGTGDDTLGDFLRWDVLGGGTIIVILLIIGFMIYLTTMPMFVMFLFCMILGNSPVMSPTFTGVYYAVFTGALANIFFTFVGEMILNGVDIMLFCFAIELDCALGNQDRFSEMKKLINTQVKGVEDGVDAADQNKVAQGKEVTATVGTDNDKKETYT